MRYLVLLPILFLLSTTSLYAQNNNAKDDKEAKRIKKLKAKYADWNNCYIIKNNGDTIKCKIRDKTQAEMMANLGASVNHGKIGPDYSVFKAIIPEPEIVYTTNNETSEIIYPASFKQLIVPDEDSEYRYYITLRIDTEVTIYPKIYRVIVDGKCKLLFDELPGGAAMGTVSVGRYYVYYNGDLTKLWADPSITNAAKFRKKCSKIFNSCPALMQGINDSKLEVTDLREIVKRFNACISN